MKNNWLVASAEVWIDPSAMRIKLAHKAGLVAGEAHPSSPLKSSGWRRVGPDSKKSGEKARQGTGLMIFW